MRSGAVAPLTDVTPRGVGAAPSGALLVIGGAALFGTVGTARLLGPQAPAASVGAARLAAASLLLLALAARNGWAPLLSAWRLRPVWVAGVAQAAFNVTFLSAVTHAGVAVGTLVAIGCTPILTGLMSRRVTRRWLLATGLALIGLVALLSGGLGGGPTLAGVGFALGASASYATFIMASAGLVASDIAMESRLAAVFTVAAVLMSPALLLTSLGWFETGSGVAMVSYLAAAATVLAYSLFNRGLRTVTPGSAATLGLTEPLVAAVLGVVVLGERLSALGWLGAATVLTALAVMIGATPRGRAGRWTRGGAHP